MMLRETIIIVRRRAQRMALRNHFLPFNIAIFIFQRGYCISYNLLYFLFLFWRFKAVGAVTINAKFAGSGSWLYSLRNPGSVSWRLNWQGVENIGKSLLYCHAIVQ